jgi:hypothetical protein
LRKTTQKKKEKKEKEKKIKYHVVIYAKHNLTAN